MAPFSTNLINYSKNVTATKKIIREMSVVEPMSLQIWQQMHFIKVINRYLVGDILQKQQAL